MYQCRVHAEIRCWSGNIVNLRNGHRDELDRWQWPTPLVNLCQTTPGLQEQTPRVP